MMRQNTVIAVVILVLALTLGAAGCGPDSSTGADEGDSHVVHYHFVDGPCDPTFLNKSLQHSPPLLRWDPNGTHILFGLNDILYFVDSRGLALRKLTDVNPRNDFMGYGLSAEISPDGSRVVYTSCEYPTQERYRSEYSVNDYPDWRDDPRSYNYEIALLSIDGSGKRRLTENLVSDILPQWSPDGERIAFISAETRRYWGEPKLYTMAPDGSNLRNLALTFPSHTRVISHASHKWSPDGERIAFLLGEPYQSTLGVKYRNVLYTVKADGSSLRRIAATQHEFSWSPDGRRLAFLAKRDNGLALRIAAADGSGIREIGWWEWGAVSVLHNVISWSPSGSELMLIPVYRSEGIIFVVGTDGSMIGKFRGDYAEWSPDGSRIGVLWSSPPSLLDEWPPERYEAPLSTIAPDGTDIRVLARTTDGESSWVPVGGGELTLADRMAQCETNAVVPNHADNPGLVEDCKTLLTINSSFEEGAANWGANRPITEWGAIWVGDQPPRVRALRLWEEIVGPLRPEIGRLSELRSLTIHGNLWGPIPPELGKLSELRELIFEPSVSIYGIPPELGNLPPELGNLEKLETLKVPNVLFLEASECIPESLVTSLAIEGEVVRQGRILWEALDDFETITEVNARLDAELKPC